MDMQPSGPWARPSRLNRSNLILIQVIGGLSILPYPFVLLATVMSIAAPGQTRAGAIPFLLFATYPAVWIVLWVISWRAMKRGATRLAFGLSAIPLAVMLCFVLLLVLSSVGAAFWWMSGRAGSLAK